LTGDSGADLSPRRNHLLGALPSADLERLLPHMELIELELGDVIYESGARQNFVYFPTTSIISLL
jgi:hypothetical protein